MDLEEPVEQTTPKQDQRSKSRKKKQKEISLNDGDFLFDAIANSEAPVKSVIADWLESFHLDKFTALSELVNFIIKAAGGDQTIPPGSIAEYDMITDALEELTANFKEAHEYPLAQKGKKNTFKKNYLEFWTKFANIIKTVLVEEDGIIPEVLAHWLTSMSSLRFRPFRYLFLIRHTATLTALTFMTGLCEYSQKSHTEWLKVEAQKDRETQQGRKATLQNRLNDLTELNDQVEKVHKDIYTGVFLHRIRDVDPAIRQECVSELCAWAVKYSNMYLDAQYLRYIGWMLNDKVSAVRMEALKSAAKIIKPNFIEGSRHFIDRFTPRIIDMAVKEADASVRAESLKVLCAINENELLEEYDELLHLALDPDVRIRNGVAPILVTWINNQSEEMKSNSTKVNEIDVEIKSFCGSILNILKVAHDRNESLDKEIVEATEEDVKKAKEQHTQIADGDAVAKHNESIVNDLAPIFQWITKQSSVSGLSFDSVNTILLALSPYLELLKETDAMSLYLLNDNSDSKDLQLDSEHETVLMFAICVFFRLDLELPKKSASKKAFAIYYQNLLKLLKKYGNEYSGPQLLKLVELVKLVRAIPMESFEQNNAETVYHEIVDYLIQMFEKHSDKLVSLETVLSLAYLTTDEVTTAIMQEGKKKVDQLVDSVVASAVASYETVKANEQSIIFNADSDILIEMMSNINKLLCIITFEIPQSGFSESSISGIFEMMNGSLEFALEVMKLHTEGDSLWAAEMVSTTIEIMIALTFNDIEKLRNSPDSLNKDELSQNIERLATFCEAVVSDSRGDIFGIKFTLPIRALCLQAAVQIFPIINGVHNLDDTQLLLAPRIPSAEFQSEANLLLSKLFDLFLYGVPIYRLEKEISDENIAAFETFIIQLFAGLCGLAKYNTFNPSYMAPTLMYYSVPTEKMSTWTLTSKFIQPKNLKILESLWNRYSDFILQKYIGDLPLKLAEIYESSGTFEAKMIKVEESVEQVCSLITGSIKKSVELYITAKVPDLQHAESLVKSVSSHLKSWVNLLGRSSFIKLVGDHAGSFLRNVHSATKIHLLSALAKGMQELASRIGSWAKVIEKCNQDYDITMQTTITDILDDFDSQMLLTNLEQVNDCWSIWGKLGASITVVLQSLDNADGQVQDGIPSSIEDVIDSLEKHLDEINLEPDNDDSIWKSYFECIDALKSGSTKKKRAGKPRKTPKKKAQDDDDEGSRPVTPKSTRSSRRRSSRNISYVERESDEEDVQVTPTRDSFKRKLKEVEFVESPDVGILKKRKE
ncbi:hypothetical protein HDV01_001977 [Terramyces sp. JEL0728]|nr:hypothetical protein HDV01_001977 [Terramyces sp. JEL0728]